MIPAQTKRFTNTRALTIHHFLFILSSFTL
jgi:hypothetical protein